MAGRKTGKKKNYLFLRITQDKYQLPLAVAGSVRELARMIGVSRNTIASAICHSERQHWKKSAYVRVEVDDELL